MQIPMAIDGDIATDQQLCAALQTHLQVDATSAFAEHERPPRAANVAALPAVSRAAPSVVRHGLLLHVVVYGINSLSKIRIRSIFLQGRAVHDAQLSGHGTALSCEQFIAEMSPLLELERMAEVATAQVCNVMLALPLGNVAKAAAPQEILPLPAQYIPFQMQS